MIEPSPLKKKETLEQLVARMRGELIISIGNGDFHDVCWRWADIMVRYGQEDARNEKRAKSAGR